MSALTCPHCGQPFTLQAVPASRPATAPAPPPREYPPPPPITGTPWTCPVHLQSKIVPAGVSKKTLRAYSSFAACPVGDCPEKGPYGSAPSGPATPDIPF